MSSIAARNWAVKLVQTSLSARSKKAAPVKKPRIGIYAGAFDPVHAGHVAFAMQARDAANLDEVIFLPERRPRRKPSVEHYAHRVAMLQTALAPHPDFAVLELVDRHFTVSRTLPALRGIFGDAEQVELVLLLGSDAVESLPKWAYAHRLIAAMELVVGVRSEHEHAQVESRIAGWETVPETVMVFDSYAPDISSTRIRHALRNRQHEAGLLASVQRYARQEWLYVSAFSAPVKNN